MTQQTGSSLLAEVLQRNELRLMNSTVAAEPMEDCQSKLLKAIIQSAQSVFSKMCGIDLEFQEQADIGCAAKHYDVSGIIAISGALPTSLAMHMASSLIFASAENFMGIRPTKLDADMLDLVGELTNMVAGGAKERLDLPGLSLGLPTVVAGPAHQVAFGTGMRVSAITFQSPLGVLAIDVGVKKA